MQDQLAVNNLIATTLNKFGRADILVNANRAIIPSNPLDEKSGAVEKSLSQNLIATLNISQLFAKSLIKQTKNRKNSEIKIVLYQLKVVKKFRHQQSVCLWILHPENY